MEKTIDLKTPEEQFLLELQNDFGFTRVVAQAVLKRSKEIMGGLPENVDKPRVGQVQILALSAGEPAGKPICKCRLVKILVTVDAGLEDRVTLRENGIVGLRRVVLLRISNESVEQGAYLTEEDVAKILRCDVRTIRRDVKHYREIGIYIPLRGHMINTGRGQSHKIAIVRWFIDGTTITEIKMKTHHSFEAITRYIDMFGRIAILLRRNLTTTAIAQVVSISVPLCEQYVRLYHEINRPEYQDQINRIVDRMKLPEMPQGKKRRMS